MFDSTILIPIVGLVIVIGFIIAMMMVAKNYIKVSPNQAAVISGRQRKLGSLRIAG